MNDNRSYANILDLVDLLNNNNGHSPDYKLIGGSLCKRTLDDKSKYISRVDQLMAQEQNMNNINQ